MTRRSAVFILSLVIAVACATPNDSAPGDADPSPGGTASGTLEPAERFPASRHDAPGSALKAVARSYLRPPDEIALRRFVVVRDRAFFVGTVGNGRRAFATFGSLKREAGRWVAAEVAGTPETDLLEDVPSPGSHGSRWTFVRSEQWFALIGFVDPLTTRMTSVSPGGELLDVEWPSDGAVVLLVDEWAQVRIHRRDRVVGATLVPPASAPPASSKTDQQAIASGRSFMTAIDDGALDEAHVLLDPALPWEILSPFAELAGASEGLDRQWKAVAGGAIAEWSVDGHRTCLHLFMSSTGGQWKIVNYTIDTYEMDRADVCSED